MSEAMMQLELAKKARLDAVRALEEATLALEKAERDVEAELLRWREMEWSRISPLSRKLVMPRRRRHRQPEHRDILDYSEIVGEAQNED